MTKEEKIKLRNIYTYIKDKMDEKNYRISKLLWEGSKDFIVLHREINSVILLNNIKRQFNKEFESLFVRGVVQ